MYRFTPEVHHPKNKKQFKKADIWPADILEARNGKQLEYWIMTPEATFIPFGYDAGKKKEKSNV